MAKGAGEQISKAGGITDTQLDTSAEQRRRESASYDAFLKGMSPAVSKYSALAGGNREQALSAAMPMISQIAGGFNGARQQVFNSMPPGAARDRALADLDVQKGTTIGGAQAQAVQQAPDILSQLAQIFSNDSSTRLGAALAGLQGAANTNTEAMKAKVAEQQARLNFFGNLVRAGTSMIPTSIFKGGGSGGSYYASGGGSYGTDYA